MDSCDDTHLYVLLDFKMYGYRHEQKILCTK